LDTTSCFKILRNATRERVITQIQSYDSSHGGDP
jgi:hypothetical protein